MRKNAGGVVRRFPEELPPEVMARAVRFATAVDNSGLVGKKHKIIGEYIVEASKQVFEPYRTILTVVRPAGKWVSGATLSSPTAGEGDSDASIIMSADSAQYHFLGFELGDREYVSELPEDFEPITDLEDLILVAKSSVSYVLGDMGGLVMRGQLTPPDMQPSRVYKSDWGSALAVTAPVRRGSTQPLSDSLVSVQFFGGGAKFFPAQDQPEEIPDSKTSAFEVVLAPDGLEQMFGTSSVGTSNALHNDTSYPTTTIWSIPVHIHPLPNKKVVVVAATQTRGPASSGMVRWMAAAQNVIDTEPEPHLRVIPAFPNNVGFVVGHGVAVIDLKLDEEQRQLVREGASLQVDLSGRFASTHMTITDYGLDNTTQKTTQKATLAYRLVPVEDFDPERPQYEPEREPEMITVNNPVRRQAIHNQVSAVRESSGEEPPEEERELDPSEIPPVYGPDLCLTANVTLHFWEKSDNGVEFVQAFPTKEPEETGVYHATASVNTITTELSGLTAVVENESKLDLYCGENTGWVAGKYDEDTGEYDPTGIEGVPPPRYGMATDEELPDSTATFYSYPFYQHERGTEFLYHFFYASSGPAIPATIVPISQYLTDPSLFAADAGTVVTTDGHQYTDRIEFALFYPEPDGRKKVVFDLGGRQPPRPAMFGLTFGQHLHPGRSSAGEPIVEFYYNNTHPDFYGHDRVVTGVGDVSPNSGEPNRLNTRGFHRFDHLTSPVVGQADSGVEDYAFTSRRMVNLATCFQRIHTHIDNKRVAVLCTPDAASDNVWVTWEVVICGAYNGAFIESKGPIPVPPELINGYPLESSNWINISMLPTGAMLLSVEVHGSYRSYSADPAVGGPHPSGDGRKWSLSRLNGGWEPRALTGALQVPESNVLKVAYKYISYDEGATWEPFIENLPGDLYYLGNALGVHKAGI